MSCALCYSIDSKFLAPSARPTRSGYAWLAFIAFHLVSVLLMVGLLATAPDPSGAVALVYFPGMTSSEAFLRATAAGARPIRLGNADWIVIAAPERDDAGFTARAHAGGALAILNPVIAGGCTVEAPPLHNQNQRNL